MPRSNSSSLLQRYLMRSFGLDRREVEAMAGGLLGNQACGEACRSSPRIELPVTARVVMDKLGAALDADGITANTLVMADPGVSLVRVVAAVADPAEALLVTFELAGCKATLAEVHRFRSRAQALGALHDLALARLRIAEDAANRIRETAGVIRRAVADRIHGIP